MAKKLYFRHGAMGSSKTANLLMVAHNYREKGQEVLILKPSLDTRSPPGKLASSLGIEADAVEIGIDDSVVELVSRRCINRPPACILVDEAQFLSEKQVSHLASVVDSMDIPVICYGLRTDFQGKLFEGSAALMAMADSIEEIKTVCWCGRKASFNARIENGKVVRTGRQIEVGGRDAYASLCRKHWMSGELGCQYR